MKPDYSQFNNKEIVILGFGIEGKSSASFLISHKAKVTVYDKRSLSDFDATEIKNLEDKGVKFIFGSIPDLTEFDLIIRSPGIPLNLPQLQSINSEKITSNTKLFFDLCPCPIIGITGTKGKGTTSSLIYEMLKADGRDAYIGGNIGTPPIDFIESLTRESIAVLELSSFQLADLGKSSSDAKAMAGKPHIAVILMLTAEHLDYHRDIAEYVESKRNLIRFQSSENFAVLNHDYPASNESDVHTDGKVYFTSREDEVEQGCFVKGDDIIIRQNGVDTKLIKTDDILLPGRHNLENVCAATMAAVLAGVSQAKIVSILKQFKGLEHRLDLVRTVKGVRFYDDSFSTTPETAQAAIEAFEEPEILILGGSSKNSDFSKLGELIGKTENIKAIIGVGQEWPEIKKHINDWHFQIVEGLETMEQVVSKAFEIAETGDVVILSPACASFDQYKDYKDRGNQFKKAVNAL